MFVFQNTELCVMDIFSVSMPRSFGTWMLGDSVVDFFELRTVKTRLPTDT